MKKIIALILVAVTITTFLTSCTWSELGEAIVDGANTHSERYKRLTIFQ